LPADVAIVGAGAAGLAAAIFTRRLNRDLRVALLDGARRPGAKILVSGGGRCNVTNVQVSERDFTGGSRDAIRQVLRALPVAATVAFFRELGVTLHEEESGKLFPDTNRARDVLDALLREADRLGVDRLDDHRVTDVFNPEQGFTLETSRGPVSAARIVLATGGQSLPKSGSDGTGWKFATHLGHTIIPPVPALVPLMLDPASALSHALLSGISHDVEITAWVSGRVATRVTGSLLWTHFGVSGPAALDISRHWTRATAENLDIRLTLNVCPGFTFDSLDGYLVEIVNSRPRATLPTLLAPLLPSAVVSALLKAVGIDEEQASGKLTRESRRALTHALVEWTMPVVGTRGYNYAEATAGGVQLAEINPRTMESRRCPGLYLVGEMVDVDGRLGGFNFQWAWSSAMAAARALAA
jgi:predicted Rossmann fold flavoprotein